MPVARIRIPVRVGEVEALRALASDLHTPVDLRPSGTRPGPGILLVHDAWGLDDDVAELATALAEAGFVVLAPDLAGGRRPVDADEAGAIAASIDAEDATRILAAAADALADDPASRPGAIGVVGLGMGAPLALFLATLRPEVAVAVAVDGPVPDLPMAAWGRTAAAVVLVLGVDEPRESDGEDPGSPEHDADAALDPLRAAGLDARILRPAPGGDAEIGDATGSGPAITALIVSALAARLSPATA